MKMVTFLGFCCIYATISGFTISITKSNCVAKFVYPAKQNRFIHMSDVTELNSRHLTTLSGELDLSTGQTGTGYQQKDVIPGIQVLSLPFCGIEMIQDGAFVGLSSLNGLNLADNNLKHLSARSFIGLPNLIFLNLNGNKDLKIEFDTFWGMPYLQQLYLSNINLNSLDTKMFVNQKNLTTLDIHGNGIKILGGDFMLYLPSLRHLDISDNLLHTVSYQNARTMNRLCSLKLDSNPWSCDCLIRPLLELNRRKFRFNLKSVRCSSPRNLQHRTFGSLKDWELKCISSESEHDVVISITNTLSGLARNGVSKTTTSILYREDTTPGSSPVLTTEVNNQVTTPNIGGFVSMLDRREDATDYTSENNKDKTTTSFLNNQKLDRTTTKITRQYTTPKTVQKLHTVDHTDAMVTTTNTNSNTRQYDTPKLRAANHTGTTGKVTLYPTISSSKFISSSSMTSMSSTEHNPEKVLTMLNNRLQNDGTAQQYARIFGETVSKSSQLRKHGVVTVGSGTTNSPLMNVQTKTSKTINNYMSNTKPVLDRNIIGSTNQPSRERHTLFFLDNGVTSYNPHTEHVSYRTAPSVEKNRHTESYPGIKNTRNISVVSLYDNNSEDFDNKRQMHVFNISSGSNNNFLISFVLCMLVKFTVD